MIQAYKKFWQGTFVFNKRTSRKDFWMALFTHLIIFVVLLKGYNFFNGLGYFQLSVYGNQSLHFYFGFCGYIF